MNDCLHVGIGKVRSLTLNAISPSMLRVSWTKPAWLIFLKSNLYVYDIAYHVTLVGSHLDETGSEIHNFSVTNSVRSYRCVFWTTLTRRKQYTAYHT